MKQGLNSLIGEMNNLAQPDKAEFLPYFFKTGPGQYGEGDRFIGLTVPQSRSLAKKYAYLLESDIQKLLDSPIHEQRLIALLLLINNYDTGDEKQRQTIYNFYLNNTARINNWDLVDVSAYKIVGHFLFKRPKSILTKLAKSKSLWERRISIIATYYFIKNGLFSETTRLSKVLLSDKEDLMHKAVGWMLREMGKQSIEELLAFLNEHYKLMPRTMLRYAIEKLPEHQRQAYLRGKV